MSITIALPPIKMSALEEISAKKQITIEGKRKKKVGIIFTKIT